MPVVAFDFLGTLFSFDPVIDRLCAVFTHDLCDRPTAERFFYQWLWSGLRDYFGASLSGKYCPLVSILRSTFARAMAVAGYATPSAQEIDAVMETFAKLTLSDTALEALQLLKENNWDIWVATNGAYASTVSLLQDNGILDYFTTQADEINVLSCDDLMISKPHPKVYSELMRLAVHRTRRIENVYMIAAHAWDLAGAKNVSYRTVFLTTEEKVYPVEMYDGVGPDLQGDTVLECVQRMIVLEKSRKSFL
ncbi:HAD-like domain-containing protein [Fennellomyces sp. T-0311]|nr:HAD-like domain-containing protein [Fennellomyces sp. T-0311]